MKSVFFKYTCLILLTFLLLSCDSGNKSPLTIDPRKINGRSITLSDIADDIVYVPLDNIIPFTNFKYVITPDYLYVSAKGNGILKFDRKGKLIKKIGSEGRGPGEYLYGIHFTVDERTGNVYVLDPKKVKVYSPSGIFLRDILYERYMKSYAMAGGLENYNSLLFLPDFIMRGNSKFNWIFLDTLGNLVSKKDNSVPPFFTDNVRPGNIYRFEDRLFY
jgi:hypothetical protein